MTGIVAQVILIYVISSGVVSCSWYTILFK